MNLNKLFKDFDPESLVDEMYKKQLPEAIYSWHKYMKHDKSWSDYIQDVLIREYQINMSDFGDINLG